MPKNRALEDKPVRKTQKNLSKTVYFAWQTITQAPQKHSVSKYFPDMSYFSVIFVV